MFSRKTYFDSFDITVISYTVTETNSYSPAYTTLDLVSRTEMRMVYKTVYRPNPYHTGPGGWGPRGYYSSEPSLQPTIITSYESKYHSEQNYISAVFTIKTDEKDLVLTLFGKDNIERMRRTLDFIIALKQKVNVEVWCGMYCIKQLDYNIYCKEGCALIAGIAGLAITSIFIVKYLLKES